MSIPRITIDGIPIYLQAGAPVQNYTPVGGSTVVRLSLGTGVKSSHWRKTAISASGTGALNPGLDGVDFNDVLVLDCTLSKAVSSEITTISIVGDHRPDVAPWGLALVHGKWRRTPCVLDGQVAELQPVSDAELYQLCWMPRFMVFAEPPQVARDSSSGVSSWSFQAEEV